MKYVQFGSLEKSVSRFGMGCMRFPQTKSIDDRDIIDEPESIRMIRYAVEHGVNYFDTAYAYSGSEEILGKALQNGYREKVHIATKVPLWAIETYADYEKVFEKQLKRLQTNVIDVYIFHCLDREAWEKVKATNGIAFMEELKAKAKIKQIGFSFHAEYDLFHEIIDAYRWDMCLIQLNILDDNHQAGLKGLKYAAQKGVSVAIMEPLKGGLLANNVPNEAQEAVDRYPEKRSLVEWAFRWLYHHDEAKVILSGVSSMEQLKETINIFDDSKAGAMNEADMQLIANIKDIYRKLVKVGCTGCGYCMPCPAGVNIPEIFKVYNDSALSSWTEFGKTFYSLVASHSGKDASNCIQCGACEEKCPQGLNTSSLLKEAHQALMG